ncbi:hypothetical protein DB347_19760 [Opitutaceae bacterium EW11]|nr:hypothetical protein DB347_19760 [Opitutaceae bacterium EW11]
MFLPFATAALEWEKTIALPGVTGRMDHMALNPSAQELYVAALGSNSVEVIDVALGKRIRSLGGFAEPQGVLCAPALNRLYVANGDNGVVRVFSLPSFSDAGSVALDADADNLRYDSTAARIYVGHGRGALGVIDPATDKVEAELPLPGHPEAFQLETKGPRIFVNVPGAHEIVVLDRTTRQRIAGWSTGFAAANFPMALDEAHRRLFVGCRIPSRLLVFDTDSGREIAKLELHGDCDDLSCDTARGCVYASCGEGFIDVFSLSPSGHYTRTETVGTAAKARTSLLDGERLFLAVPREGSRSAEIRVYRIRG